VWCRWGRPRWSRCCDVMDNETSHYCSVEGLGLIGFKSKIFSAVFVQFLVVGEIR